MNFFEKLGKFWSRWSKHGHAWVFLVVSLILCLALLYLFFAPNSKNITVELKPFPSNKEALLKIGNLDRNLKSISYAIEYQTESPMNKNERVAQGVIGSINPSEIRSNSYEKVIKFGTCSAGGTCIYHKLLSDIDLTVSITRADGDEKVITKKIKI